MQLLQDRTFKKLLACLFVIALLGLQGGGGAPSPPSVPTQTFEKTFGGRDSDGGNCVAETKDGGYIIVGTTYSFDAGGGDVYLIKTDSKGNKVWEKNFGGRDRDEGYSVAETKDGGYIIVGGTWSFGPGYSDVYLIKTDSEGNKVWEKTFGGRHVDVGYSVAETKDGGYIIVGKTLSFGEGLEEEDVYLIKTDSKGNMVWEKTFGGRHVDAGYSVAETKDGGYIIVGRTYSCDAGMEDVYLIKTDSKGNMVWEKNFGGRDRDEGYSVAETKDGGYIIVGRTWSFGPGYSDVYLIKTDSEGNKVWEKTFGGRDRDEGYSVAETKDGGYIIVGWTGSFGAGEDDVYLIKTDSKGNVHKGKSYVK
ncbi:hypothetical protein H5T88_00985 [bacterium]|nr:hypothetical protein [bacterium]